VAVANINTKVDYNDRTDSGLSVDTDKGHHFDGIGFSVDSVDDGTGFSVDSVELSSRIDALASYRYIYIYSCIYIIHIYIYMYVYT
jgi:hypothetical protein